MLTLPLPAGTGAGRYVVSLQYQIPGERAGQGPLQLPLPRVGGGAWAGQMYWQLLLPAEEHLLTAPPGFTGEYVWRWNDFYYGRQPVMDQADLESWVGLPQTASAPAEAGMNSYLFSTLRWNDSCEIFTVGRSMIVLIASAAALLAGLALIYIRAARHPVVLLTATILLAGGAMLQSELALLAAQAAVLGLVLSLLALVLRQWLSAEQPVALPEASSAATMSLHVPRPSELSAPIAAAPGSSKAPSMPLRADAAP